MKQIAIFDFDGTLTVRDTLIEFIIHTHGKTKLLFGILWLSPILLFYKLKLISNSTAKQFLFGLFYKGWTIDVFNKAGESFREKIHSIENTVTLERLKWHLEKGDETIIISASIENWILPWAIEQGVKQVLATQIEVKDNILTGRFSSANCYGQEKVVRFQALYPDRSNRIVFVYGDSCGDKELMLLANRKFWVRRDAIKEF